MHPIYASGGGAPIAIEPKDNIADNMDIGLRFDQVGIDEGGAERDGKFDGRFAQVSKRANLDRPQLITL